MTDSSPHSDFSDPSLQPDLSDRELFEVAAEHFSGQDFDSDALDAIWSELAREPKTARELAETLDDDIGDLEHFLDWVAEQEIVEAALINGKTFYSRYDVKLEKMAGHVEEARWSLRGLHTKYSVNPVGIVAAASALIGLVIGILRADSSMASPDVIVVWVIGSMLFGIFATLMLLIWVPWVLEAVRDKLMSKSNRDES